MAESTYEVGVLIQGYPGKSAHHGGLGWSAITLLRGGGRVALVDTGSFGVRPILRRKLKAHGVEPGDVTDVLLTHAHYDHAVNYILFPEANVWIGESELEWAAGEEPSFGPVPELYVRDLLPSARTRRVGPDAEVLPSIRAVAAPGHTPGSLAFHLTATGGPVLFTGDAAKNRAELLSRRADMSLDQTGQRGVLRRHLGAVASPARDTSRPWPRCANDPRRRRHAEVRRHPACGHPGRARSHPRHHADFDLSGTEAR